MREVPGVRSLGVIAAAAIVVALFVLFQPNRPSTGLNTDSQRGEPQHHVALVSRDETKPQHRLTPVSSAFSPAPTALLGSLLPLSPVYYLDVEPKEQKYLRLATNFEGMLKQVLRHNSGGASTGPETESSSSLVTLQSWSRKEEEESEGLVVAVHNDGSVAKHLPETASGAFSRALVPVTIEQHSGGQEAAEQQEALRRKLSSMRVAQLRRMLRDLETDLVLSGASGHHLGCEGCVEKFHLVQRIMDLRGWNPSPSEDAVAWALAVAQDSAAGRRPLPHHFGIASSPEANAAIRKSLETAAAMQFMLECTDPSVNGTVSCTPRRRMADR